MLLALIITVLNAVHVHIVKHYETIFKATTVYPNYQIYLFSSRSVQSSSSRSVARRNFTSPNGRKLSQRSFVVPCVNWNVSDIRKSSMFFILSRNVPTRSPLLRSPCSPVWPTYWPTKKQVLPTVEFLPLVPLNRLRRRGRLMRESITSLILSTNMAFCRLV